MSMTDSHPVQRDVEDFHRSGVLQFSPVSSEFRAWAGDRVRLATLERRDLATGGQTPGVGLELLRQRLLHKDGWIFDEETFAAAVRSVGEEFVDGVLATPYDGSMAADRAISGFTSRWIEHLITSVALDPDPPVRSSHVTLSSQAWHEVSVLKFVHQHFILDRPDLAMFQRGQGVTLDRLVVGFDSWLSDRTDGSRAPRRLIDLVNAATFGYERIVDTHPEWLGGRSFETDIARMGRGRGIIDFVSGLTDDQAVAFASRLGGASGILWSTGAL